VVITVEASTTIARPVDDVWAFLSDLDTVKAWDPETVDVTWRPPIQVGATFTIRARAFGRTAAATARITEYEPFRRIGWEIDERRRWLGLEHRLSARVSYVMDPIDAGSTNLSRREVAEVTGALFRVIWPIIAWRANADRAEEITNIRRILEEGASLTSRV
jgi:hypothetical protein